MAKQWTRNYDNLFVAVLGCYGTEYATTETPTHGTPYFRDVTGTYFKPAQNSFSAQNGIATSLALYPPVAYGDAQSSLDQSLQYYHNNKCGIKLGTGTSEPTYDDAELHTPLTANLTLGTVSVSTSYDEDTHIYTRTYKMPIAYSGADPINVTEFGIYIGVPYRYSPTASSYYHKSVMVYRETLDTPVTLEQNDTIEITFSQSIMQPNYTEYPATE